MRTPLGVLERPFGLVLAALLTVGLLGVLAYFSLSAIRSGGGNNIRITDARWEGERAVVEGSWEGELSAVYCSLYRGQEPDSVADWWDRSRGPTLVWSDRTFEQDFVEDEGREAREPLDPEAQYSVRCSGMFVGGRSVDSVAPVEGAPG